ncbi:unnamed protein product [Brachionus calyciflorus]|uniref:Uncharacterized protein n=1 Tax=Brachionus calyciflorus TaxID=104777 RepID=A0A813U8J8_9BILA|nr:unnamed protein product [Brachionus calyciflorus]
MKIPFSILAFQLAFYYWNGIFAMSYTKMFGFYEISSVQIGNYVNVLSTILLGSLNGKSKLECFKTCSLNSDCLLIQFDSSKTCSFYKSIQSPNQSNSYTYFYKKIENKGIILEYTSQVVQDSKAVGSLVITNNVFYVKPFTFIDHLNLSNLDLSKNVITRLDENTFYNLSNLISLYMGTNKIQTINYKAFVPLINLETLYLNFNLFDYLNPNVFKGLKNLVTLYLNANSLKKIELGLFKDLKSLSFLNLNRNFLDKITLEFSSLISLKSLYLKFNQISVIEECSFRNMSKLIGLYLDNNKLKSINMSTFEGLDSLTELYMSNNLINSIDSGTFANLNKIVYLDISKNNLSYFENNLFSNLTSLLELRLSFNQLKTIDLDNQINLQILDLSYNQYNYFKKGLVSLKFLDLSYNPISFVNYSVIDSYITYPQLENLTLIGCQLVQIDSNSLKSLVNLKELYIQLNALNYLNESIFFGLNYLARVTMDKSLYGSKNFSTFYPNINFILI